MRRGDNENSRIPVMARNTGRFYSDCVEIGTDIVEFGI